ncbi:metallophosphoesterase [Micractinium conductrix]|uniref:Metallophosphoesterase n=1 Tax=Micractinium conductrix TaxID=554055 RepID=A0A2P6VFX0_9CHLO|nr:metallophosphoesterase [Micractinium conductrix]|eukprot:PSC72992.1 metallophosphoesterase [Micractinium conductrix]
MGHGLRQQWPALALALVGALAVATCVPQRRRSRAGGVAVGSLAEGTVRVVVLSDTHLAGPEYPLFSETGQLDNTAITRTQQRFWRAVHAANAVRPPASLALFAGDVVHNGIKYLATLGLNHTGMARLFAEPVNGFSVAAALLSRLRMPRLYAWGNHDSLTKCGQPAASAGRALLARVYRHYFGGAAKLYSSVNLGPWKVVSLNSMLGPTWDPTSEHCNTLLSSYGEEQLRWLDGQLAEGRPTVVVTHFPLTTSVLGEVETRHRWRDLASVLSAHSNVRLALSGHFHKGFDWQGLYPFPAAVLPAIRYNPQSFQVLDLLPDGSWEWADAPKNRGGGRCSDWWSYAGQARFEASVQPNDGGDCGVPAAGEEAQFALPDVLNRSSIPPVDRFNPERSCRFELAGPFLRACADGATPDCCDVVADTFRLSSTAPFSTCLCQPAFFEAATAHMEQEHGQDLTAVLGACVQQQRKLIVYRGGPLTWCPAPAD